MFMRLLYILILYSPRRCKGIGLSDGEGMERLWSYLRRFSRMTKEMRPAHHIDVLSGGLEYYAIQRKQKLGMYMCTYAFILYILQCLYSTEGKNLTF